MSTALPHHENHDVLEHSFSYAARERMAQDDLDASKNVLGVIITIVTLGMVFGIVTVYFCQYF